VEDDVFGLGELGCGEDVVAVADWDFFQFELDLADYQLSRFEDLHKAVSR